MNQAIAQPRVTVADVMAAMEDRLGRIEDQVLNLVDRLDAVLSPSIPLPTGSGVSVAGKVPNSPSPLVDRIAHAEDRLSTLVRKLNDVHDRLSL